MRIQDTWPTVKLEDVIQDMQPGFAQRPNSENEGTPQLRTNNVSSDGRIDLSEVKYVTATKAALKKYGVRPGDVIFNNTNSPELVGKTAYFDLDKTYVISNHMTRLRTNSDLMDAEFLAHYLHYLWQIGVSNRWAKHWVNQAAIDQSGLAQLPVPVPPLAEQARIVAILRQADALRRLRQEAREKADGLLAAVFYEMFGDCNPEKEYPKGWEVNKLKRYIANMQYGLSTSLSDSGDVGVLRMGNISVEGWLDFADMKFLDRDQVDFDTYDLRPGDILFNRTNSLELVGKTGLWELDGSQDYTFASYIIRMRLKKKKLLPEYLWALMNSLYGKYQVSRLAKQAVNMANINSKEFASIPIVVPPLPLQEKFIVILDELRNQMDVDQTSAWKLEKLFQSTLSRAFSGELTAVYRDQHQAELQEAAVQRDIALGLRGEEPRLIDFTEGRVTPAEEEQFLQQIDQLMQPAAQEMVERIRISQAAFAKSLMPVINVDIQYQSALVKLAETIRPALPNYENLVNTALAESVASLNRATKSILASAYDATAATQPIVEAAQRSQALYQSLGQTILAWADAQMRQAAEQPPPQPERTLHPDLNAAIRAILQASQAHATYFTPPEMVWLLESYGHRFRSSEDSDLVQVEAALELLETAGFVRQVVVDDRPVYRLVDPVDDGALLPEEIA